MIKLLIILGFVGLVILLVKSIIGGESSDSPKKEKDKIYKI